MLPDQDHTQVRDIASRLGKDKNYVNQYRIRLLAKKVIRQAGHGKLAFAVPYFREYLIDVKAEEEDTF